MKTLGILVLIFIVLLLLRYPPAIDGKNYWGFQRPNVRPALNRLRVDVHGNVQPQFYSSRPGVTRIGDRTFVANKSGYWAQAGARVDYISVECLNDPACLAREVGFFRDHREALEPSIPLWCEPESLRWMLDELKLKPSREYVAEGAPSAGQKE